MFEEANRTRAAMCGVLRLLAARGIGGALPDLPGTNESLIDTADATLADWRAAFAAAAAGLPAPVVGPVFGMAWRGGALVDTGAALAGRWHLSPLAGAAQRRELDRLRHVGGGDDYAGNRLSARLLAELDDAAPAAPARVARLASDPLPCDRRLPGPPLWRASEPGTDEALQRAIADDIAAWIASCGA